MKRKRNIRYVAYIKVSTDKQEESGVGLEVQQSIDQDLCADGG